MQNIFVVKYIFIAYLFRVKHAATISYKHDQFQDSLTPGSQPPSVPVLESWVRIRD